MENKKTVTIVVDGYGGDNAPFEIVKGCVLSVNAYENLNIFLVGKEQELKTLLSQYSYNKNRITIVPANEVISNEEAPVEAVRTKKDSSLLVALEHLKKNDEISGLVSAGSTGAVLTGGFLKIGRFEGISRPALCPILPTVNNRQVALIDCGANMDATSENLMHFAIMGSLYMQCVYGIKNPRVALLNVGVEEHKGNNLTKEAYEKLKTLPINFIGNMEARDALSGKYDVIVADGFSGNVLLKGIEGAVSVSFKMLKNEIKSSKFAIFGSLFMKPAFKKLKEKLNYSNYGGSPFLGLKKTIIKSHGSSDAISIKASIKQIMDLELAGMQEKLKQELALISKGE